MEESSLSSYKSMLFLSGVVLLEFKMYVLELTFWFSIPFQ